MADSDRFLKKVVKSHTWHMMKAVISVVDEIRMKGELSSFQLPDNNDSLGV